MIRAIVVLIALIVSSGSGFAQAPPSPIETKTGTARVFRFEKPFKSVVIGNPDIIDARTLSDDRTLLLTAKDKAGRTNLILLDDANQTIYSADIVVTEPEPDFPKRVRFHTRVGELNDYFAYTCTPDDCVRLKDQFQSEIGKDIFIPGLVQPPQQNINVNTSPPPSGGGG
jgi:hypothetical protein